MQFWEVNFKASLVKQILSLFMRVYQLNVPHTSASIPWETFIKDANNISAAISWFPQFILTIHSNPIQILSLEENLMKTKNLLLNSLIWSKRTIFLTSWALLHHFALLFIIFILTSKNMASYGNGPSSSVFLKQWRF